MNWPLYITAKIVKKTALTPVKKVIRHGIINSKITTNGPHLLTLKHKILCHDNNKEMKNPVTIFLECIGDPEGI